MLSTLALLFGLTAAQRPWGSWAELNGNDYDCHHDENNRQLLVPDIGIYEFDFGKTGTWAYQSFLIDTPLVTLLEIWDCFCTGDDFIVYINGQRKVEVWGDGDKECQDWSNDPVYCWSQGNALWGYGFTYLTGGRFNVTVGVRNSPYGKGTGYLSLTSVCQEGQGVGQCCGMQSANPTGMCNYRTVVNANACHSHHHHHHHGEHFCHHRNR